MASRGINKVILIGNLGIDPDMRATGNGTQVCNFSLATSDTWTDKDTGERKERTEWHRVVVWAKLAEIAGQYLRKGSKVYIEGGLRTRKWQGQDGQDRYTTEIHANQMVMLGGGSEEQNTQPQRQQAAQPQQQADFQAADDFDDDIPF